MSAFVFKIQANMDPNHRDRIAFARLCSGKLSRGMKAKLVRTGKNMSLSSPQFFFAQDRSVADEAFAGDVVGIPNHGTLRIGDTLTEGEDLTFVGVPIIRAGNRPPGAADRCDEGEEAERSAAADVGGGRRAGVPPARRRARAGRRGRPAAARRAEGAARCGILAAGGVRGVGIPAGALDFVRRPQEARCVHRRQRFRHRRRRRRRSRVHGARTSSISATPRSAPRGSSSPP